MLISGALRHIATVSLTALSLSAAAPVTPIDVADSSPVLSANNFTESISTGVWWVEFFSPYCGACKAFAPTWKRVYQEAGKKAEQEYSFRMARVDCIVDGDICQEQGIGGYPSMRIYKNGQMKHEYESRDRGLDVLLSYMERHIDGQGEEVEEENESKEAKEKDSVKSASAVSGTLRASTTALFPAYPDSTEMVNTKYPAQPVRTEDVDLSMPNPYGRSENLDQTQFTRQVSSTKDPWIIKFFSPYCPHCRHMADAWSEMAGQMKNRINIGEVNCEVEVRFCREGGIVAFPTIKYIEGPLQIEYEGLRGVGDLVVFADSALASRNIPELSSYSELQKIAENSIEAATYLYFYDDTTFAEDFEALQRMALNVIPSGNIYKTKADSLIKKLDVKHFPSLYAILDENKWFQYPGKDPSEMRDHDALVGWAREMSLFMVPQLTPVNARKIFDRARYVVLAVVDPRNVDEKDRAIREVRATALKYLEDTAKEDREELLDLRAKKMLKVEEAKDRGDEKAAEQAEQIRVEIGRKPVVGFAWIDGVFWERWLKTRYGFDLDNRKPVIINDQSGRQYWDVKADGNHIPASRSQLLDVLEQVMVSPPEIPPQILLDGIKGYLHLAYYWAVTEWHISGSIFIFIGWLLYGRRRSPPRRMFRRNDLPVQLGKFD